MKTILQPYLRRFELRLYRRTFKVTQFIIQVLSIFEVASIYIVVIIEEDGIGVFTWKTKQLDPVVGCGKLEKFLVEL